MNSVVTERYSLSFLSILRIFTGLSLLQHGTAKIVGFPAVPVFRCHD